MGEVTWDLWLLHEAKPATEPPETTGIVIPFRREPDHCDPPIDHYYADLAAIKEITAPLAHPAKVILLIGVICDWLYEQHGPDEEARLNALKEFARGVRIEIRGR